ncbi:MAG TPA: deoxyribose-phosphate aldolase [Caldilineaceae bacterium]|nr:deoxyribose-phosphate aldolase [Caldilineaceae bacterium]
MNSLTEQELSQLVAKALSKAHETPTTNYGSVAPAKPLTAAEAARLIDHTLLKPEATEAQIRRLCDEAKHYRFASVCVHPTWVSLCRGLLVDSPVKVCSVVGFPLGATLPEVKGYETERAIQAGAHEIDMVINIGRLKSGAHAAVFQDIAAVVAVAHRYGALVKAILEMALLTEEEKVAACALAQAAGVDFVKTATGFSGGGATVADVALMRRVVGPEIGVKAAGGIRTADDLRKMVAAGATRIGASAGVSIIESFAAEAAASDETTPAVSEQSY